MYKPFAAQVQNVEVDIIDETIVKVQWKAVSFSEVSHYTVYYSLVSGVSKRHRRRLFKEFPNNSTMGYITDLLPTADYQFQVTVTLNITGNLFEGPLSILTDDSTSGIRKL